MSVKLPTVEQLKDCPHTSDIWIGNARLGIDEATVYEGPVTGLSHHQYSTFYDQNALKVGKEMLVRPHPDNKYDQNAIGLNILIDEEFGAEEYQIGWIPKGLNYAARIALNNGFKLKAKIYAHMIDRYRHVNFTNILYVIVTIENPSATLTPSNKVEIISHEGNVMTIKNIASQNYELAKAAAFLEAGRIANNQVVKVASKKLPIVARGYADTPMGRLVIANIAMVAQQHFRKDDQRLKVLTEAMVTAAYQEVIDHFDIEGFIDDLFTDKKIKNAMAKLADKPKD